MFTIHTLIAQNTFKNKLLLAVQSATIEGLDQTESIVTFGNFLELYQHQQSGDLLFANVVPCNSSQIWGPITHSVKLNDKDYKEQKGIDTFYYNLDYTNSQHCYRHYTTKIDNKS